MKFLMLGALLFSSSVFACPNLTGSYTCKTKTYSYQKEIQQTENGYIMSNDGIEVEYVANGNKYDIPSTDSYKDAQIASTCNGDQFLVSFTSTVLYEGTVVGKQVTNSTYAMDGDNLVIVQKIKMKKMPLPLQTHTCTRNN